MSSCPVLRVAADGRELVVDTAVQVTVGRDAEADLNLINPRISRRHLVLRPDRQGWVLEDLGSTNGTFHEGRRISLLRIDRPVRLRLGDPYDGVELRVEPDLGAVVKASARAESGGGDRAGAEAAGDGKAVPLVGEPLRLGRAAGNDVVIRDPTVSSQHAELLGDPGRGFEIVDRGSRNGTFVNGKRVGQARLRESDRIGIGYHEFRLLRVGPPGSSYVLVKSVDRSEWWRLAATIAISVLTVFGAGLAFWSAYMGARAVDDDRRAVLETVRVHQQQVGDDTQVRSEQSLAAAYRAAVAEVDVLNQEAAQARNAGRPVEAAELEDRARLQETVARRLRQFVPANALEGEGARASFQVEARRQALAGATLQAREVSQLDPDRTAGQARRARQRSVRLQAWSVVLVVVLAVLTYARLSEPMRPWLIVSGMVLLAVVSTGAVLTVVL